MTATQATETVETSPGRGRPTSYKPEYCDVVIELGKQGYSRAMMASHLDVAKSTITEWASVHKEFSNAIKEADSHAQAWYEQKAHEGLTGGQFNAQLFKIIAYNRFRDDYADRKEVSIDAHHTVHHSVLSGLAGAAGQIEQGQVIDAEALEVLSDDGDEE